MGPLLEGLGVVALAEHGQAQGQGQRVLDALEGVARGPQRARQALGHDPRAGALLVGEQDPEARAAGAPDHVHVAHALLQGLGPQAQQAVAAEVPVVGVDQAQAAEVDREERERVPVALGALDLEPQGLEEPVAVDHPRHAVGARGALDLVEELRVAQGDREQLAGLADHAQRRVLVERALVEAVGEVQDPLDLAACDQGRDQARGGAVVRAVGAAEVGLALEVANAQGLAGRDRAGHERVRVGLEVDLAVDLAPVGVVAQHEALLLGVEQVDRGEARADQERDPLHAHLEHAVEVEGRQLAGEGGEDLELLVGLASLLRELLHEGRALGEPGVLGAQALGLALEHGLLGARVVARRAQAGDLGPQLGGVALGTQGHAGLFQTRALSTSARPRWAWLRGCGAELRAARSRRVNRG
ncbi:MAG: hypothetical protein R3F62_05240 [Planctomycetota bacterium]